MKNSLHKIALLLLVFSIGVAKSQMRAQPLPVPISEQVRLTGGTALLDPARFSMNHGFSYSLGTSPLGGSQGIGVYTNNISYLITDAIALTSQIFLVQPSMGGIPGDAMQGVEVYYQAALNWRISDNLRFSLDLSNVPRAQGYYGGMTPLSYMQRRNSLISSPGH